MAQSSGGQDVKSTAVVKYTAVETPAQFRQLKQNTDLKQPPANWLQGNSKWENYMRNVSFRKGHFFSSFNMGHCYPDLTGEIDVVSDAENIKTLLKIPYSQAHVSMMVHRVGNTLLLDDFDIHRHLLRQQEKDWRWLRKFYYETVVQNMQSRIKGQMRMVKKNKSRDHLQNRNMFSKFLYYSIRDLEEDKAHVDAESTYTQPAHQEGALRAPIPPLPPDPQMDTKAPGHQRTQEWTFEDIHMLVGTDLPIFGGGTHPCVSLRLREMREPINVLTGMDYWLDNLICNVPELAMCYHLDGIVQSYKLLKTEDIPKLPKSEFSPEVVKGVAQNILSFLKSNATKEGHTYWLFKGHGDDVVKLYDLTTLCSDLQDDPTTNPFTVPVGMLLYRVARNMATNQGRAKSGTIRKLLEKCLLLLDAKIHAQVVTSAQYLLCDLYISDHIATPEESPDASDDSDIEDDKAQDRSLDDDPEPDPPMTSVDVQTLRVAKQIQKPDRQTGELVRYPRICGKREDRCREARAHIAKGLKCLDENVKDLEDKAKAKNSTPGSFTEEEKQATCDPDMAIPMHYSPLQTKNTSTNETPAKSDSSSNHSSGTASQLSVFSRTPLPNGSWHQRSKTLLLRKAVVVYYGMAEAQLELKCYGMAWKYITMALHCFSSMRALTPDIPASTQSTLSDLLSLAGDLHLVLAHSPQDATSVQQELARGSEDEDEDVLIIDSARLVLHESDFSSLEPFSPTVQTNSSRSCDCYQRALQAALDAGDAREMIGSLRKRLGNSLNELGVLHMNAATSRLAGAKEDDWPVTLKDVLAVVSRSSACLERGVAEFWALCDALNTSLLYSNLGRLQRVCAQAWRRDVERAGGDGLEVCPREITAFNKAQDYYKKALSALRNRDNNPEIWDSITWELSSTCFTMATLLQDHAPLSNKAQEQIEVEVIQQMERALRLCDVSVDSPRHALCVYRAATIHHRLASLHHNAYRNQVSDKNLRQLRSSAESHYTDAARLFSQTEGACELLRVQLERVALCEYTLQNQTSATNKTRTLSQALQTLTSSSDAIALLAHQVSPAEADTATRDEADKLTAIFVARLQFVMLNLVKWSNQKSKKSSSSSAESYKVVYSMVLKSGVSDTTLDLVTRCQHLSKILLAIDVKLNHTLGDNSKHSTNSEQTFVNG